MAQQQTQKELERLSELKQQAIENGEYDKANEYRRKQTVILNQMYNEQGTPSNNSANNSNNNTTLNTSQKHANKPSLTTSTSNPNITSNTTTSLTDSQKGANRPKSNKPTNGGSPSLRKSTLRGMTDFFSDGKIMLPRLLFAKKKNYSSNFL